MAKKNINNPEVEELKTPTNDFDLVNEEEVITDDDFKLVSNKQFSHDQKFETKPTTFLKDSLKRFGKNKSSVVASVILGIIIIMAIFVPIFDQSDVNHSHPEQQYLAPKANEAGTGFWDGCKAYNDITVDLETGYPAEFNSEAVLPGTLKVSDWVYIDVVNTYGLGGYVRIINNPGDKTAEYPSFYSKGSGNGLGLNVNDENIVKMTFTDEFRPQDYELAKFSVYVQYYESGSSDPSKVYLLRDSTTYKDYEFDISATLKDKVPGVEIFPNFSLGIEIDNTDTSKGKQLFIKSVNALTSSSDEAFKTFFDAISFNDANKMLLLPSTEVGSWNCLGATKAVYHVAIKQCSFIFDTYEDAFGKKPMQLGKSDMDKYIQNGWCTFDYNAPKPIDTFKILSDKCPIISIEEVKISTFKGETVVNISCHVMAYKYYGYDSMPKFIMGTDKAGRDMFKYVFEGLRTSLIMGVITAAVCFTFGLIWGAISGYFGGNVDLAMERFTDILSGMPWIVVMTLCIVHLGQTFGVFVLALCLTGWIGTSATTRTQFYRFKGREYVLASRTLGASDLRIIFKHILPNAMGTIITGAVLMVPSVIFSEASISYLGLGLKGLSSLGVILSDNQAELLNNPYLLLFPSVIIALLMICFNLFGNGLRDAINPSLKGEGE